MHSYSHIRATFARHGQIMPGAFVSKHCHFDDLFAWIVEVCPRPVLVVLVVVSPRLVPRFVFCMFGADQR